MLLFLRKRLDTVGYVLLKVVEEEAQVANASNRGMPNHEHPSCPVEVTNYQ